MPGTAARRLAQARKIMEFDRKGLHSLILWATRRRHEVPPGATALPYAREQASSLLIIVFVTVVETVVLDLLLRGIGAPEWLRVLLLVLDLYSIVAIAAVGTGCATRPHVVTPTELRIRYGVFFDLRVPRDMIASVRLSTNYNEPGFVTLPGTRLGVAVSSQTNVVAELTAPVTVTLPLGRRAEATRIHFFTDTPAAALAALAPRPDPAGLGRPVE
ncbi:hypothetical protein [Sphaerisporangium aureirubrum]|uniref:PH domain-containing protein n=1 Tax=Sphaerisporangium aureirubrum TaxID=1544736 RepID=A0ABW1NDS3_9ACTN